VANQTRMAQHWKVKHRQLVGPSAEDDPHEPTDETRATAPPAEEAADSSTQAPSPAPKPTKQRFVACCGDLDGSSFHLD